MHLLCGVQPRCQVERRGRSDRGAANRDRDRSAFALPGSLHWRHSPAAAPEHDRGERRKGHVDVAGVSLGGVFL